MPTVKMHYHFELYTDERGLQFYDLLKKKYLNIHKEYILTNLSKKKRAHCIQKWTAECQPNFCSFFTWEDTKKIFFIPFEASDNA